MSRPRTRSPKPRADDPPAARSVRPRVARLSASERKEQLLDVARRLLATEGSEGLRLPRLAELAGVSKPVVYDHFPTRHALVAALLREYGTYVIERLAAALTAHPDDQEAALRAANHAYFECVAVRGASMARLGSSMLVDPEMRDAGQRYRDKIVSLFADALSSMVDVPASHLKLPVAMLVAAGEEAIHQWEIGTVSREVAEETQITLILATRAVREQWLDHTLARTRPSTTT